MAAKVNKMCKKHTTFRAAGAGAGLTMVFHAKRGGAGRTAGNWPAVSSASLWASAPEPSPTCLTAGEDVEMLSKACSVSELCATATPCLSCWIEAWFLEMFSAGVSSDAWPGSKRSPGPVGFSLLEAVCGLPAFGATPRDLGFLPLLGGSAGLSIPKIQPDNVALDKSLCKHRHKSRG